MDKIDDLEIEEQVVAEETTEVSENKKPKTSISQTILNVDKVNPVTAEVKDLYLSINDIDAIIDDYVKHKNKDIPIKMLLEIKASKLKMIQHKEKSFPFLATLLMGMDEESKRVAKGLLQLFGLIEDQTKKKDTDKLFNK